MAIIREEHLVRHGSIAAGEDIDIATYDRIGRRGGDANLVLCEADDFGVFLILESSSEGDQTNVAYLGANGFRAQLALGGSGSKGEKLAVGADGVILSAGIGYAAEAEDVIGVALEDWTDSDLTEYDLYKV